MTMCLQARKSRRQYRRFAVARWRRWLAISATTVLAPLLLLVLAELALRLCGVGMPTGVTRPLHGPWPPSLLR